MPRWRVWIEGWKRDLQRLKDHSGDTDWCIEFDDPIEHHYIRAERFENLDTAAEVHASATALVDEISLAALSRWAGFGRIMVGAVHEMRRNGTGHQTVMVGTAIEYREDADHETGSIEERIALLHDFPNVANALRYIRDMSDWNSYYRAYEAIGKSGEIVKRGLVSKSECERFSSSARARHHKVHSPNKSPMTKGQGRVWITNVVRRLVASLIDER